MYVLRRVPVRSGWDEQLLVVLRDGEWTLPPTLPTRYKDRAVFDKEWHVKSESHGKTTRCGTVSFYNGMWATRDDSTSLGGSPTIFGRPIEFRVLHRLKALRHEGDEVRVAYHGTSGEAYKSIRKSSLNPTRGQLGIGVYVGSFWKACRFAARDQNYAWRAEPTVIRVLWTCDSILTFPLEACTCDSCFSKPPVKRSVCRHGWEWKRQAGFLPVGQYDDGTWITRNEEWCIDPQSILQLAEAVVLDSATVNGPHYDPLQRDIRFK